MQYLPMLPMSNGHNATALSLCQTLSTPLSFWEFQQQKQAMDQASFVVSSPCKARISQILAEGVSIDNLDKDKNVATLSCLSDSTKLSFTIKCSSIDTDALRDVSKTPKLGSGNIFLANDCLVALCPIEEGQELFVDAATLDAKLFMALPEEARLKLVGFTEPSLRAYLSSEIKMPVLSVCPKLDVRRSESIGEALRAVSKVEPGETLYNFEKEKMSVLPFATMYTIQVANGVHFLVDGGSQCLAHSCDPNTHIVIDADKCTLKVVAIKEIAPDDIVSFNYLCTEFDMDCPFECACGAENCFGKIAGFRHLTKDQQHKLLDSKVDGNNGVSPVVAALAKRKRASAPAIETRAADDFSRGAIITVRTKEAHREDVEGTTAPEDSVSNMTDLETVYRAGTGYFSVQDVNPGDLVSASTAGDIFTSSSSDNIPSSTDPNATPSSLGVKEEPPLACRVGESIVALRDIKKGQQITVRRLPNAETVTAQKKKTDQSAASSSEKAGFTFTLTEEQALKTNAHIVNLIVPAGTMDVDESSTDKDKKQPQQEPTVTINNQQVSSIKTHQVTVPAQPQKDAERAMATSCMNLAATLRDVDQKLPNVGRSSLIVVVDDKSSVQSVAAHVTEADLVEHGSKKSSSCCMA